MMEQPTEREAESPTAAALAERQHELEHRVLELEQRVRELMTRLAEDELEQFERVEQ
jgi:hypothetical protein